MHTSRAPRASRLLATLLASALLSLASPVLAALPERFPADAPGVPADGESPAAYLSYFKVKAMEVSQGNAIALTPNQSAYDVTWYDLDLTPNPTTKILSGVARVKAIVVNGPLTTMELDFASVALTVDAVTSAGVPATWTHAGDLLTVNLDRPYANGESMDVKVTYHGQPQATGFGSFGYSTVSGLPLIWTLSEPYGARSWWPCKDQPADKADSVDVRVWVPVGMITASNGTRVMAKDSLGLAFSWWKERYPISTYLVSITSYAYSVVNDWYKYSPSDSMPLNFFLVPSNVAPTAAVHAKVKGMLAAFAARFDSYPFLAEKYGHAQFPWGGGMEHQTCTSLGSFSEGVVAHELGHQWWGDMVTCRDFHHIWLNEGFASFCEAIWEEAKTGLPGYQTKIRQKRYYGAGTVYCPDTTNVGRIFDSNLSYNKASWVLHMLRHAIGDSTFFLAMRDYRAAQLYGTATTELFRAACETRSGRDLTAFFNQWVYGEYYPVYRLDWSSQPAAGGGWDVQVWIRQTQAWQLFNMPIDVTISAPSGNLTFVARDSLDFQMFQYHVPTQPTAVQLDKDEWILRQIAAPAVAVEGPVAHAALALAPPFPNPGSGVTRFDFALARAGRARLFVVDAAGRRVATLRDGTFEAGAQSVTWSGRADDDRTLAAGLYWVCLEQDGARVTRRVARLR